MASTGWTASNLRVGVYDPAINPTFSTNLWQLAPCWENMCDPSVGILWDWPCVTYNAQATTGEWVGTAATTGSAATHASIPGAVMLDAGATTAAQGFQIQNLKAGFIPAANKSLWWETTIQLTATTPPVTKAVIFIGLAASDTTIFAAGSMTTNNRLGWMIQTGGNLATTFTADKAGASTTKTGPTLVSATAIKLGFYYDGVADTVQQYVNGVASQTAVTTTNVPKASLIFPSFACLSDGTDQPNLVIQGARCFQIR